MGKRQADIAEAALIKLNRPFVTPGLLKTFPFYEPGGKLAGFNLQLEIKNGGNSPARRTLFYVNYAAMLGTIPDNFDFLDRPSIDGRRQIKSDIPAGSNTNTGYIPIKIDTIRSVWEKRVKFFLWGWITYEDIFGIAPKPFKTLFCWEVMITGDDPISPTGQLAFNCTSHGSHNCMDEDCP